MPLGDVADDLAKRGHPRALERRQQQLALAQVLGPVEHKHRMRPKHGLHERVGLAGPQVRLISGEELADRLWIGDVDSRAEAQEPHGEHVAEAPVPFAQHRERPVREAQRIHDGRAAGTGRERHRTPV